MENDRQTHDSSNKKSTENSSDSSQLESLESSLGFNPETLKQEFQELVEKKFGGKVQVLSMDDPFTLESDEFVEDDKTPSADALGSIENFNLKPRDVKNHLDRYVIGQEEAKRALSIAICDHYNYLRDCMQSTSDVSANYQKQNVMILGPTGVGKTYLVRLMSELIGVPFVKADATRFSEVGYMGANVDDIVRDLVHAANGDKALAAKGIVYVDEVDKLASRRDHTGRDVSGRGVQFGFLRLLENSDVDLNASHDIASQFKTFMNFQRSGKAEKEIVNTKDILFIFSGAFHGLEEIINNRLNKKTIGLHESKNMLSPSDAFRFVESKDLVDFGFEHEFIGRLPIRVSCSTLSKDDLFKILTESEHSILHQYERSFRLYGIELKFQKTALETLAQRALEQGTGARGLVAVFEEVLRPFKFELPSTSITELTVSDELVRNPMGCLHHLMAKS